MATKAAAPAKKSQDNAEVNRMKRLLRTQKRQPNNLQIDAALKTTRMHRKTPANPVWSATWRKTAQLIKQMSGRFDPSCLSSNPEVARAAMAKVGNVEYKAPPMPSRPFSLAQRTKDKYGNYVWAC